jgi:crotonobetainyl-CoA:carnitine CoA-transferase CaiB-like acyl-CoA transferase
MSITGPVDAEPTKHGVAIVDIATGLYAAIAILGALQARERTGLGQSVSVSLYQTGVALLANVAANHLASGRPAGRFGNGHPNIVPYRTFAAADGQIALAVGNDSQFRRFAALAGHPEWGEDPRLATNIERVRNRGLCDGLVAGAMAEHPRDWWIEKLRAEGVPCGSVNDVTTALADPQTAALGMVQEIDHPLAGLIRLLGTPFTMSATPPTIRRPPPLKGEHTDEVLAALDRATAP